MKKTYRQPEFELIVMEEEDVITTSGGQSYDPQGILNSNNADEWQW